MFTLLRIILTRAAQTALIALRALRRNKTDIPGSFIHNLMIHS